MSTAAVSSQSIFQELQSFYQNRQSDLKQLGAALQSGDLSGAQQAYKALAVLGESGPFANSEPFAKSARAQAFDTLGEALQAGDLARAQTAFAALTNQANGGAQTTPAAVVNLSRADHNIEPQTVQNQSSIYQQLQAFRQQRQSDLAQLGQALQSGDLAGAQTAFNALTALGQSGPNKNGQAFQRDDRNQDFQAIGSALQSGDLAGAQAAFASLAGTFGKQDTQAQNAISAYTNLPPSVNNTVPPAVSTGGQLTDHVPPKEPPVSRLPPSTIGSNPELVITLGATNSNSTGGSSPNEIDITIGASTGANSASGSNPLEIVINSGGANGSSSAAANTTEIDISLGNSTGTSATSGANAPEIVLNLPAGSSAQITIDEAQSQNGNSPEQLTVNLNQQSNQSYELILNLLNTTATQASTGSALSLSA